MNKNEIIAEIKLAPGEVGYYDEYSRIYLTNQNPIGFVYAGTNLTQIRRSVRSGRLQLIRGTFDVKKSEKAKEEEMIKQQAEIERKLEAKKMAAIADAQAKEEKEFLAKEALAKEKAQKEEPKVEVVKEVKVEPVVVAEQEKPVKKANHRSKKAAEAVVKEAPVEEASK